jgi:hypothetical protein
LRGRETSVLQGRATTLAERASSTKVRFICLGPGYEVARTPAETKDGR